MTEEFKKEISLGETIGFALFGFVIIQITLWGLLILLIEFDKIGLIIYGLVVFTIGFIFIKTEIGNYILTEKEND